MNFLPYLTKSNQQSLRVCLTNRPVYCHSLFTGTLSTLFKQHGEKPCICHCLKRKKMQPASCHEKIQLSEFMFFMFVFFLYIYIIIECLTGFIPKITSEMTESALPIIQVFNFHHIQGARAGRDCSY